MELSAEQLREARRQMGSAGGKARAKKLSKKRCKEIARKAARTRWGNLRHDGT